MKRPKEKKHADQLTSLLTKDLMDIPSAEFSDKLLHVAMTSYKVSYSTKYRKEEHLGKIIMVILIFFNLMMLYKLNPFGMQEPILLSLLAFIVAIGILIRKKINPGSAQTWRSPALLQSN